MQNFDFTKHNPKVVCIHTKEKLHNIEEAIFLAYANLVGCDTIIISPTGYRSIERFYTQPILTEHQDGEYHYELKAKEMLNRDNVAPKSLMERMKNIWQ